MTPLRLSAIPLFSVIVACGGFDLDVGLSPVLEIDKSALDFPAESLQEAYRDLAKSLRSPLRASGSRFVLRLDPTCGCGNCSSITTAYVLDRNPSTIFFCPLLLQRPVAQMQDALKHEMLHLISRRSDHLACESKALMTETYDCRISGYVTKLDIAYVCKNATGGICGE
jgi:hypothetical protein